MWEYTRSVNAGVGVAELLHHVGRILADRDQDRGVGVPQLVRGDPERKRLGAALLGEPVRRRHDRVDHVLAQVVPGARNAAGVTKTGSLGPVLALAALCSVRISRSSGSM
jgi:hypothetical protein